MNVQRSSRGGASPRSGFQMWPIVALLAVAGGVAWYGFGPGHWFSGKAEAVIEGATVQRGPLKISVVDRGNLKAADAVSVKSEIEGQTTILSLVPEGTFVKEGDLLFELDATQQVDKRFQQEISVRNAEAAYVKSKQNYEIQKSQNESDIEKAKQSLFFADTDLKKFREGEKKAQEDKADESIKLAEEEFTRAQEKVGWSEKLAAKGFLTNTELEADKLSLSRAQIQLEQGKRDKDLLIRFQLPRDEAELSSKLDEANRELERVKLQAAARIVDYEADLKTKEAQLTLEREKLSKLVNQIAKAKMFAPRAGMVVYSQEEGGRYGNSQPIKEGTTVRERQEIINIPSAAGMVAQVSLHESVLKMVQVGQRCVLKIDALGTREFHGAVKFVAMMADQNSWFANPNTRLYRTEVQIEDPHPEMRPGMSCSIEIMVDQIADATFVPVQSVFRDGLDNVAFVQSASGAIEKRVVEVGKYNDRWVQILKGLTEGETVLMSTPPGFSPEPAKEKPGETSPTTTPSNAQQQPAGSGAGGGPNGPGVANGAPGSLPGAQQGGQLGANGSERGGGGRDGERGNGGDRGNGERGNRGGGGDDARSRMANMSEEERAKMAEQWRSRMANMTEEERAKAMEEFRNRRGGGGGGGSPTPGGGGAPGGGQAAESNSTPPKQGDGK